jgi:drug/metabolite transporter (DMT)-like permease
MPSHPPLSRSGRLTGLALSGVGAMLFAIKGILIKLIYRYGLDTTTLLAIRMILCVPVFAGVGIVEWRRMAPSRRPDARTIALAAATGVLGYYVSSWLDFEGLQTLDAQIERLILFTYPFFVILFGRALLGHPLRLHAVIGAGLSYVGLIVMFAGNPGRLTPAMLIGAGLVLTAAMTFALYQIFARELILRCGATLFTAIAMAAAGAVMLLHFGLTHNVTALALPRGAWPLVLGLALFATIIPAFMMSAGTARIGAQGTAIVSTLSPLVTIALAIVILGEPFGPPEAIGTLFVLGGVGLFSLIESRRPRA